jgi:hypothetical protein
MFQVGAGTSTAVSGSKVGYYNGPRLTNSTTYGSSSGAMVIAPPYFYAFDSTDVRRDVTITPYAIPANNTQTGTNLISVTDGKFRRDWHVPALPGTGQYLDYNWPLIRFSDVLLMFAEAENELNGPTLAAQNALLEVRTRGFGTRAKAAANLNLSSKENFFNAVVNERYLEFGGEGIRKYDLIRWNLFATKIAEVKANIVKMANGQAPYDKMPLYMYYRLPASVNSLQWTRSFFRPSPTTNGTTPVPASSTLGRVNWRFAIDAAYVANLQPAGTSARVGTTTAPSTATGLAAEYQPGKGKELLPIPQTTISADPALVQNFGY